MKRTLYYAVAVIANALASVPSRIYQYSTASRLVSRSLVVARRRFRPAVFLIVLASLFVSSTPSAPNSVARLTTHSGMTATLRDTASQVAGNLYQSLRYRYASSVSSLPIVNWKTNAPASPLTPMPLPVLGPPTGVGVTAVTSASISLSWSSPGGAVHHYQVERSQSAQGPFMVIANPVVTGHQDNTVSNGAAYLYRVRAVDSLGAASSPSTMAVGTAISFEDPALTAGSTPIKKQHIYDLRQTVNAVRALAGLGAFSWTNSDLTGVFVQAIHVQELRNKLDEALTALSVPVTAYTDPVLATGVNGTPVRKIHIEELRLRSTDNNSTSTGAVSASGESAQARLDPANEIGGGGENPLSRNYNLNIPLLGLSGRAGLDLGLSLSYNSLVWTKHGSNISFDDDAGFPSPGFRLGFPVIQPLYFNSQVGKNAFLLIGSDGSRTELRQVNTSALYEAADSSYLLLDSNDLNTMTLRTADGTQLTYVGNGSDYQCTKIKDGNGNFITVTYTAFGRISTVVDTLERVITFNYDGTDHLTSITQQWNGQNHVWASFEYFPAVQIQTNFPELTVVGPSTIKAVSKVTLNDDSRIEFDHTSYGQIWRIKNFAADGHQLNYRAYNLPGDAQAAQTDCPRFTTRVDWAENFNRSGPNGTSGLPAGTEQEVPTNWIVPISTSWTMPDGSNQTGMMAQVTGADGTYNKIYFEGTAGTSNGWKRGLASLVETYDSGNVRQRQSVTAWTQDDTGVSFPANPRVTETNVYDPAGNRARTTVSYQTITVGDGTSCKLPADVTEFQANATTPLRRNHSDYNSTSAYLSRRIIGLVSEKTMFQVDPNTLAETLMSRVGFSYDDAGSIQGTDAPVQHDNTNYAAGFVTGRANLTTIKRFDVNNTSVFTSSTMKYNTAGAAVTTIDPVGHTTTVSYADNFSDGIARNTLAYPTSVTVMDPGNITSTAKYNFDFGALTRTQAPPPAGQSVGAIKHFIYDSKARLEKTAIEFNGNADYSHTRLVYPNSQNRVDTYVTVQEGMAEAHSFTISDGHGRTFASVSDHPGSSGGFSAKLVLFNNLGRAIKSSNPTETSASGTPTQWVATGDDAVAGWLYSQQTYDWKGRPLVTTNTDGTTKEASYGGCGCAGGEVVTLTDEGTMDGGVFKRRQQKIYSDVLGRTVKTELFNWQGGSVFSAAVSSYNARDQVTQVREFAGAEGSSTYQDTTTTHDGYGRVKTRHQPEQQIDPANSSSTDHTTWDYNDDDTIQKVTDARGSIANFSYNARHLVTGISYAAPESITPTASASFSYDAVRNRTSMTDGSGNTTYHFDQLSRMDWEQRTFSGLSGAYRLSYEYNLAGELKKITEPAGPYVDYAYDSAGRMQGVSGAGLGTSQYASSMQYRAWGGLKSLAYGNSTSLSLNFNQRGQVTHYAMNGVKASSGGPVQPEGGDFQYYADGQLKFASDLRTDATAYGLHDRAYAYDQAAGLKEAYSGYEARDFVNGTNSGIHDGAFRQSYTYDAWGNLTTRTGRFWSEDDLASDSYNSQNRNPLWEYDADGRLVSRNEPSPNGLTYQPLRFTYDAAGRRVQSTQTTSRPNPNPNSTVIFTTSTTNVDSYDGEGMLLKSARTTQFNSNAPSTAVTFYLRSRVLGGGVIAEYDAGGVRQNAYVFAGGEILAQQQRLGDGTTRLMWQHINPLTGDGLNTDSQGVALDRTTVDPMGVNVGDTDPFVSEGGSSGGDGEGMSQAAIDSMVAALIPGYGGPTCKIDGMITGCSLAFGALSSGAAVLLNPGANTTPRVVVYHGQSVLATYRATYDGYQGYMPVNANYAGNGNFNFVGTPLPAGYYQDHERIPDTDFSALNHTGNNEQFLAGSPQNSVSEPIHWYDLAKIRTDVKKIAGSGRCQEFLTKLLERAGKTGGDEPVHTDIGDLFDAVLLQQGFWTQKTVSGRGFSSVRGAVGAPGGAQVRLSAGSEDFRGNSPLRIQYYAYDALSELTHVAGSKPSSYAAGAFSDYHLAKTALDVANGMGTGIPNLKLTLPTVDPNNDPLGRWSDFYHRIVKLYCPRQERF